MTAKFTWLPLIVVAAAAAPAIASPLVLPPTVTDTRCYDKESESGVLRNAACADNGIDTVFASASAPYPISVNVLTKSTYVPPFGDGLGDFYFEDAIWGSAVTRFAIGFVLLKDLPADFDYDAVTIPYKVATTTSYTNFSGYVLDPSETNLTFADGREDGECPESSFVTQVLLCVPTGDITIQPSDYVPATVGFTDLEVNGERLLDRVITETTKDTDLFSLELSLSPESMRFKGDGLVIDGMKGAACIADATRAGPTGPIQEVGCHIDFDPVISFDQAAFDAMMGSKTFALADYFQLVTSEPSAVPEPGSWAMMIGGLGLAGAAIRRRRLDARLTASRVPRSAPSLT